MKVRQFEQFVEDSAAIPIADINYSFVGLAGETGEIMEWHKKANIRKNPNFTPKDLQSELGDILHYIARIGAYYGITIKDMMSDNVGKIEERIREKRGAHQVG